MRILTYVEQDNEFYNYPINMTDVKICMIMIK